MEALKKMFGKLFGKKQEPVKEPANPAPDHLWSYFELNKNLYSIYDYINTQDVAKIISGAENEERGLEAISYLKHFMKDISVRPNKVLNTREIRNCEAMELMLVKIKEDPQKYMKSPNPVARVFAYWRELDLILDTILEEGF